MKANKNKDSLKDMDRATKKSYAKRMRTYKPKDYDAATADVLDQMGKPSEEVLKEVKDFLKEKYGVTRKF
jgi:hypothetical protein